MSIVVMLLLVLSIVLNVLLLTRKKGAASRKKSVRSAILLGIQNVNELATIRERFQSIVSFSEGKPVPFLGLNFPGTTRKFMMRYAGTIVCGNDLSKVDISERFAVNRVRKLPRTAVLPGTKEQGTPCAVRLEAHRTAQRPAGAQAQVKESAQSVF